MDTEAVISPASEQPVAVARRRRSKRFAQVSVFCTLLLSVLTGVIPKFPELRGESTAAAGLVFGGTAFLTMALSFVFARRGWFRYPLIAVLALLLPLIVAVAVAAVLGIEVPRGR